MTVPANRSSSDLASAFGSIPSSAALTRSTWTWIASPAGTTPDSTDERPPTWVSVSATFGARSVNTFSPPPAAAESSANRLTTTGSGLPVRSPSRSSISWAGSTSSPGTSLPIRSRMPSITGCSGRRGSGLRRTKKSPLLLSLMSPPRLKPVRRLYVATSGVSRSIASTRPSSTSISAIDAPGGPW